MHHRLFEIEEMLDPKRAREVAISELNDLFRQGKPPDPAPDGILRGRAICSTVTPLFDGLTRRMASLYMPWFGKKFFPDTDSGLNLLAPSAVKPIRVMWPFYEPEEIFADRIEAFPFRTKVGPGAIDADTSVLKIDYDFDSNPEFIIRRVLDELVQIDHGLYLGKVLFRVQGAFRLIGFFALEK
jgi:hypothetical protein